MDLRVQVGAYHTATVGPDSEVMADPAAEDLPWVTPCSDPRPHGDRVDSTHLRVHMDNSVVVRQGAEVVLDHQEWDLKVSTSTTNSSSRTIATGNSSREFPAKTHLFLPAKVAKMVAAEDLRTEVNKPGMNRGQGETDLSPPRTTWVVRPRP